MQIINNQSLKDYNSFGIRATAKRFIIVEEEEELYAIYSSLNTNALILGGGSNLLFTKKEVPLVLLNEIKGLRIVKDAPEYILLELGAGENWDSVVRWAVDNDYGGIENLALIPGSVGAAPMQNIGAYGVELKDVFHSLWAFDTEDKVLRSFHHNECEFAYRESVFKTKWKNRLFISKVILRLTKSPYHKLKLEYGAINKILEERGIKKPGIKELAIVVTAIRKSKLPDPSEIGNAGSFFKNPIIDKDRLDLLLKTFPTMPFYSTDINSRVKIPAAWLIEQCGWKGKKVGNTGAYKNQALVIVNHGNAEGKEIKDFALKVIESVNDRFEIQLSPEVNIID